MSSLTDQVGVVDVVIGVDTHVLTHTAAVVNAGTGGVIGQITVPATAAGYAELVKFTDTHQPARPAGRRGRVWAIEGTGGHGAGLARHLLGCGERVVELDRPERAARRHGAKSDPLDAVRAAREALARPRIGTPRTGGARQALSVLLAARRSAVQAGADAQRQVFGLVIAAPEALRARFAGQKVPAMIATAARLRHHPAHDLETTATIDALRTLARRVHTLAAEAAEHHRQIRAIVQGWRPDLLAQHGVGPITAATVLCAWSHPGRIHSEAGFAMLAGAAPIPATSGQTTNRYRLNRSGDRHLNQALHIIIVTRLRHDPATRAYAERRTLQGKNPREIKRCLKRYLARSLFRLLEQPPATT